MAQEYPILQENIATIKKIFSVVPREFCIAMGGGSRIKNLEGENLGSLAILTYASYFNLTIAETLPLFGGAYYEDVLNNLDGSDHQNIRALMTNIATTRIVECVAISGIYEDGDIQEDAVVTIGGALMSRQGLVNAIDDAWELRGSITPNTANQELKNTVDMVMHALDKGELRVADRLIGGPWVTHQWIKKAILLSFRIYPNALMSQSESVSRYYDCIHYAYDKVKVKFAGWNEEDFLKSGIRVVPGAIVRHGAYVGPGVVLMPSFVNIGASVGEGTMVDAWATVGSCAQVGKNCHISGGAGIGGVLEPLQANPTIIGDNCFIGARSEIVEGVIVEDNCVISMGVFIGQSTKIYNRQTGEITYGRVPAGSVVVPGSLPTSTKHADGSLNEDVCHLGCAVIIKQVDAQTRSKTSLNELLRE